MKYGRDVFIRGLGSYSPGQPIPFDRTEEVLGPLTDIPPKLQRWVERMRPIMKQMLGLEQYYYGIDPVTRKPTESNVTMGAKAARKALAAAKMECKDIDLIIYAGIMMENICPPTTVLIQEELKMPYCAELSIHSNCTSVYKALQVGSDLIANGRYRSALIISSQLSSSFLRADYFNQAIMEKTDILLRWFLCDGAGAMVLSADKPAGGTGAFKVEDTYIESVGLGLGPDMYCLVGGSRSNPLEIYKHGWHHLKQNFDRVAQIGPPLAKQARDHMVAKTGLDLARVKYFFANVPTRHLHDMIVSSLVEDKKLKNIQFYTKLSERGYPGPCAILIALDEFTRDTALKPGDVLVSMVTESSKWMHGGFILEYVG